jgi:AmmeMemoRadiSam system protein A
MGMMLDEGERFLTREEEALLLRIARASLKEAVWYGRRLDLSAFTLTPPLEEKHGAFVTLRRSDGELRGCVGYVANCEPLAVSVRDNAFNAALRDNRFLPVTHDELDDLWIEISALLPGDDPETPFRRVHRLEEIKVGRDGLYVERPPSRGGVLLPQVAVEEGWDVMTFLGAVCRKAGYAPLAWKDPETRLYRFSAQVFAEGESRV